MIRVAKLCDEMRIEYLVGGSMAAMQWGRPRLTIDVDIVAAIPSWHITEFCEAFPEPEFYVSIEAARHALLTFGQFNIIQPASGVKCDIFIPKFSPFDESQFSRTIRRRMASGEEIAFCAPEDTILKKLEYYKEGRSHKHTDDIGAMLTLSRDAINIEYINQWSLRIGVGSEWTAVKRKLGIP